MPSDLYQYIFGIAGLGLLAGLAYILFQIQKNNLNTQKETFNQYKGIIQESTDQSMLIAKEVGRSVGMELASVLREAFISKIDDHERASHIRHQELKDLLKK